MNILRDFLLSITLINILDILIISFVTYFSLSWLKGTRSFQILATFFGLGVVYLVAGKVGLTLTSVLFQYLWAAIIIVLAIVFQPELREMLERASPIRALSGRKADAVEHDVVEATVRAVTELARSRLGAIIVFQRFNTLEHLTTTGRALDGLVSAESLIMIFQKTSPLHDGAVVIKRNRMAAASCILPLSTNEELSSRYGTRHRAAIGLTERSDALCVVVSEERGEVSIAVGGRISVFRTKAELESALETGLAARPGDDKAKARKSFAARTVANWQVKLVSVGLAAFLWMIFVGPRSSEIGISVPIQYMNLPQSMEITGKWMDRIDVRVRGSESGLANLKPESIRATVDLSQVVPGPNFFRVSNRNLQVPPGITVTNIRPNDLHLTIESASAQKIAVAPTVLGSLPEKTRVSVIPQSVTVRALDEDLKQVRAITTEPVKASELAEKKKVRSAVVVQPEGVRLQVIDPQHVVVTLEPVE
jgi:uncharacterized protein (TIGR00159 family)